MIDKDQYFSISKTEEGIQPGDRCYYYYRKMVDKWKANPRWTTAHEIYKDMTQQILQERMDMLHYPTDDYIARELAWQCFFNFYVLPYEMEKMEQHGNI
jgi:hypothetical protein